MCQNGAQLFMDTTHTLIHCIISKIGEDQRSGPTCCFLEPSCSFDILTLFDSPKRRKKSFYSSLEDRGLGANKKHKLTRWALKWGSTCGGSSRRTKEASEAAIHFRLLNILNPPDIMNPRRSLSFAAHISPGDAFEGTSAG
jgi:hypothetical protein